MANTMFAVDFHIASAYKGQVTIPKDIREVLGVASGDRITFIVEGNTVRIVNSAVYAMQVLQKEMSGKAERTNLTSDKESKEKNRHLLLSDDFCSCYFVVTL